MSSHVASFSGIDSSYSLPDNVALITLQVLDHLRLFFLVPFYLSFHCNVILVSIRQETETSYQKSVRPQQLTQQWGRR